MDTVRQRIWAKIEEELEEGVPLHIKNIFDLQHIQPLTLKIIESAEVDNFIVTVEKHVRTIQFFRSIPQNSRLQEFFGDHHEFPDNFEFTEDDKTFIRNIIELMQRNPEQNWRKDDYISEEIINQMSCESTLLNMLIRSKENNEGRNPEGRRYETFLKLISMYLYMVGGKICYETLSTNL